VEHKVAQQLDISELGN
jgi:hypothetical protein